MDNRDTLRTIIELLAPSGEILEIYYKECKILYEIAGNIWNYKGAQNFEVVEKSVQAIQRVLNSNPVFRDSINRSCMDRTNKTVDRLLHELIREAVLLDIKGRR